MSAREEVLARVRAALGSGAGAVAATPREYRAGTDDGLEAFAARLAHYGAALRMTSPEELPATIGSALRERSVHVLVVPPGIPDGWVEGVEALRDEPRLSADQLDGADGVLTSCALAIAQTGTIVLDCSAGMGRRALSLIPDYHLCVVRAEQIVGSLPEAIALLDPVRPLTFISGPSATVDIEMVRVAGVHGPRRLEVIVTSGASPARSTAA